MFAGEAIHGKRNKTSMQATVMDLDIITYVQLVCLSHRVRIWYLG